ncbi:MAG: glycosyltransferase [Candidatus Baltobacteraceae bacterium]
MKRLLLVAHSFPPAPSAGSLRPGYLAHYLPQFGWDVTVLTSSGGTPPFHASVVSAGTPSAAAAALGSRLRSRASPGLRRIASRLKESLLFPDVTVPWVPPALRAANRLLETERFDAVLSTAHPASAHILGWAIARKAGVPWVADYRDAWTGNPYLRSRTQLRAMLETLFERTLIRRACAVSTISRDLASQLHRVHRHKDIAVIPNAYDPAEWNGMQGIVPAGFDLCYAGSMYDGTRNPDIFFEALAELCAAGDPAGLAARVHFYGPNSEFVSDRAKVRRARSRTSIRQGAAGAGDAPAKRGSGAAGLFEHGPDNGHGDGQQILGVCGCAAPNRCVRALKEPDARVP